MLTMSASYRKHFVVLLDLFPAFLNRYVVKVSASYRKHFGCLAGFPAFLNSYVVKVSASYRKHFGCLAGSVSSIDFRRLHW